MELICNWTSRSQTTIKYLKANVPSLQASSIVNEISDGPVTPSHLEVTRGDHVSWPTMKTVIPMMMMINILTGNNPSALQMPLSSSS
jgi:hypothetical protein